MVFLRSADVPQLYAASDDGNPPAPGTTTRWFLLPQGGNADATLTVAQAWATAGTFVFLQIPLPSGGDATFATAAWRLLGVPSFIAPRVAWFPSGVPAGGALQAYVLSVVPNAGVTSRTLSVEFRNYALIVAAGTALGFDESAPALTLAQTSAHPIAFTTGFGATTLDGAGSIAIPLQGTSAGALQFALATGTTNGVADLRLLDVGMRTYFPAQGGGSTEATLVDSLAYPLLGVEETPVLLATLAPWSDAEAHTFFSFDPSTGALESCYRTVTGHALSLTPVQDASGPSATAARLVLATRPSAFPASPDDLYTLVPKGDFLAAAVSITNSGRARSDPTAAVVTTPAASRLMCGLSGVEYVGLASANAVAFFTGGAAYADGFDPASKTPAPTALTSAATTAWALPCGFDSHQAAPLTYFAQPDGAVLFQPSQGKNFAPLVYLEVPSATLAASVAAAGAVPLLPYAGVAAGDPDLETYRALEAKVVSPNRRATIASTGGGPPAAVTDAGFHYATGADVADTRFGSATPQGLLALFTDTSLQTIDELVLAQMADGSRFSLHDLPNGDPLRTALGTNQLFLVLTNPAAIAPYLAKDPLQREIVIEGWSFALDSDQWTPPTTPPALYTAMIFKFAQGRLADLINDAGSWAKATSGGAPAPNPFNLDDAATSKRLSAQIQAAIEAYEAGDPDFATFAAAATDPTWQGIVFLNVTTPLTQLPDQCKGLAAGIDPALFRAHHVAVEIAKIDATTTPLSVKPSSMFALIHYAAPQIPVPVTGAPYQFQVDSLKVLFVNSAIASFSSKIELMIRELFGDEVDLTPDASILYLYGALQHQTVDGVVYDTYLFRTLQNVPADYPIVKGNVFNAIRIDSAQFVTELNATSDGLTHAHFALAGLFDFAQLDLDVFSFGRDDQTSPVGLPYSKLLIRMTFDPPQRSDALFTFDASTIALDPATAFARPNSLYNHFPVTLAGIVQADSVTTPGGAGYLGLQSPLTQSKLLYPWFGLVFDLDLGTLGALAAKAGFIAQLIAAWSPSAGSYKVFVGLKLPGSDGGKGTISVEGVLNMSFRALVLGRIGDANYFLLLNALALKLLSVTFPPGGQIDMALFGNPVDEHNSSLGWYAAYTKEQAQKSSGAKDRAAHAALRQTTLRALGGSAAGSR